MPTALLAQPTELVVRLADEGIPVCAIARATGIVSSDLRDVLLDAKADGRILDLPRNDWPIGPRDQRAIRLSRLVSTRKDDVDLAIRDLFGLTLAEVKLMLIMLQRTILVSDRCSRRTIAVHVHHLRKRLAPFNIEIDTIHAVGYRIRDRQKAVDLVLTILPTL